MANPPNPDCRVNDTSQPPVNRFSNDGTVKNVNVKNGTYVAPQYCHGTLDLSTSACAETDSNYLASLMAESLSIAAGPVNIFPMLGVHNQGSTLDQPGDGFPISSGTPSGYNTTGAFTVGPELVWRSIQTGSAVTSTPAFIGYDFGTKKAWDQIGTPQERYYPAAPVRKQIATLKLMQSADPAKRALQLRIEASDDGVAWTRIDVLNVQNTNQLVTLGIHAPTAYNKWRLVPTFFAGVVSPIVIAGSFVVDNVYTIAAIGTTDFTLIGATANTVGLQFTATGVGAGTGTANLNSPWEVLEVHMLESSQISLDNIEDYVLLENRDRAYCHASTMLKCTYDLLDVQSELAKFGITLPQTYIFTCSFADMIIILGRPVVIGDIVELPGEIQFDPNLKPVRKWLEVTDAGWSTEGYTPNWRPNLFRFYAQPIMPSIEHKDILGVPGQVNDAQSDDSFLNSLLQNDQAFQSTKAIKEQSIDAAPQTGEDGQDLMSGKPLLGPKGAYDGNDLYAEDALPPDGNLYSVGDVLPVPTDFPPGNVIPDGHYHRQTYTTVAAAIRPPDRLLRYFTVDGRWKVIEVNTRGTPESHKKTMAKILSSANRMNPDAKP